ncbi:TonB-dependent receptor [Hymenobacter aerilatus]|uniref:TonB-dependent receptor n=1 Tax=Hymenobacter aerilatus TaxID=2932251 RepID=A0A8T9STE5_9BACT|nr:TonB-dependent receptor [Hymenobacter aerilatus]UOR03973.1 TonB-dependent receptor [Hymenobacter aerilatus]
MRQTLLRNLLVLVLTIISVQLGWSQGATTAAMNGTITDQTGSGLPGATIIAVHTPTNTQYVAPTNSDGRYNIQGMRVGGPYSVRVTFVGYQDVTRDGIFLTLGQNLRLDVNLNESTQQLGEVVVSGRRDPVINSGRTGAETNVGRAQIQNLPTLNRSLNDFTRLTPQANGGGSSSIGGANNRYNNITIDGAVNNDIFGLAASGTPGGQAGTNPIALDAIDQIQVVVAPYDITLGNFAGGGINAVTRSGSNDLSASIYGFGRNQNTIGKSVTKNADGKRTRVDEFYNYQTGFRVGGAVVKDKVFFFLNAEIARNSTPLTFLPGTAGSTLDPAVINEIGSLALSRYGYDAGATGEINRRTQSNKIFARLDFNLSENNTLTLRHNYIDAFDDNITRTSNLFRFGNNGYRFDNSTNTTVAELNSRLGRYSNKLILSYNRIRDKRSTLGTLFPQFQITENGNNYVLGTERSSAANSLDQDIVELTDNLTAGFGKHTLTVGTHNEFYKFRNLFLNNGNGYYTFRSLADFRNNRSNRIQAAYPTADNGEAAFSALQLGFYAQDQYAPIENLRLTLGVRLDVPVFFDKPGFNQGVTTQFGSDLRTDNVPSGQLLWAPRLGFNWDVNNDSKVQVRGGTGIFTGRVPFVWISNSYTNSGLIQGAVDVTNPPATQNDNGQVGVLTDISRFPSYYSDNVVATSQINLLGKDFKLPQVWRTNLAVDFRLPGDVVATVEGIYSKTINDIYYQDINLTAPVGRLAGPDQRPVYAAETRDRRVNRDYTNVYLLQNTSRGYRYNATAQLQKQFVSGLNASLAYTYGVAKDINSGSSSTASSNFQFNQIVADPNNPELGYSRNDQRHRVLATAGYKFIYAGEKLATTVSAVYEGYAGAPLTYIYGNNTDLNRDNNFGNDLLYVPRDVRDANEIILVQTAADRTANRSLAQIQSEFDTFIENDPYLRSHRGQYVERFGARLPWTHQVDLRVAQDFNFMAGGKRNTIQITLDIINAGNLLNREWGRQYFVNNNAAEILRVESTGPNVQPTFSFPSSYVSNGNRAYSIAPLASRWQSQLGIRYIFN